MTFIPLDDFMIYYEDSERVMDHCLAFLKELKEDQERNLMKENEFMSHEELLALIGEVDGIGLQVSPEDGVMVTLSIGGYTYVLITAFEQNCFHNLTREGLREVLNSTENRIVRLRVSAEDFIDPEDLNAPKN